MAMRPPTYSEYLQVFQAANDALIENGALRRRIVELEERLLATELTPERAYDLGSSELTQLAAHYHALLEAIVDELRARHQDVAEELIAPRIRALEDQVAAAKERAWQARSEAHELQQETARLMEALQKLADVQPEQALELGGTV
jgi:hypothetical protein